MSRGQIGKRLEQVRRKLAVYKNEWPRRAGIKALEFVDDNFKAQGYRDGTLVPWRRTKSGKRNRSGQKSQGILIKSARLRRGMQMRPGKDRVRIFNKVPYARVHNEGFNGWVTIRQHNVRRFFKGRFKAGDTELPYGASMSLRTRRALKPKKVVQMERTVYARTVKRNIPRRQFMPSASRGSRQLTKIIRDMTQNDIRNILKIMQ